MTIEGQPRAAKRPHTGRRRNEAARAAILQAATDLVIEQPATTITIDAVVERSGVGRQTIYRWWPTKETLLLDALVSAASNELPLAEDERNPRPPQRFIARTYRTAGRADVAAVLRAAAANAFADDRAHHSLDAFVASRRADLRELLLATYDAEEHDIHTAVDIVFGVLWYRILFELGPLDQTLAHSVTTAIDLFLTSAAARPPSEPS